MIHAITDDVISFKYTLSDIYKRIVVVTEYSSRSIARDRKTPDYPNPIEYGAIDEDDRAVGEDILRSGIMRVLEVLTFLTNDLGEPLRWLDATATSEASVMITINKMDWMSTSLPALVNDRIMTVIVEYALREWFKIIKILDEAQLHGMEYENAKIDLRTACRMRGKPASRTLPVFP